MTARGKRDEARSKRRRYWLVNGFCRECGGDRDDSRYVTCTRCLDRHRKTRSGKDERRNVAVVDLRAIYGEPPKAERGEGAVIADRSGGLPQHNILAAMRMIDAMARE